MVYNFSGKMFLVKKVAEVGLDIGAETLKAVRVKKTPRGLSLLDWREEPLGEGPKEIALPRALEKVFQRLGGSAPKAQLVFGGPPLMITHLTVPLMAEKELAVAGRWQAEQQLHTSLEKYLLGYLRQGQKGTSSEKQMKVLAAALPTAYFTSQLESLKQGGGQLVGADILPLSLAGMAASSGQLKAAEAKIILHWGAEFTSVSFFEGGHLQFYRDIPLGSKSLTAALSQDLGISTQEAEALKKERGIPLEGEDAQKILGMMRSSLEQLVGEIKRSIGYYQKQREGKEIKGIILSGGGALLKNLPDYLSRSLALPVELIKPGPGLNLDSLAAEKRQAFTARAAALAPALGLFLSSGSALDFFQVFQKQRPRVVQIVSWARILLPIFLALFLVGPLFLQLRLGHLEGKLEQSQKHKEILRALTSQLAQLSQQRQDLGKRVKLIQHTLEQQLPVSLYLKEISWLIPEEVILEKLDFQERSFQFSGFIPTSPVAAQRILSEFLSRLESSAYFQACGQVSTFVRRTGGKRLEFSFQVPLVVFPGE